MTDQSVIIKIKLCPGQSIRRDVTYLSEIACKSREVEVPADPVSTGNLVDASQANRIESGTAPLCSVDAS
jgi:hypothetical protein